MPTLTNETLKELVRDIVSAYVEFPEDLRLAYQESADGNSCYWALRGRIEDEPDLVGARGTHVKALTLLITEFGLALGSTHTFRLVTDGSRIDRDRTEPQDAVEHEVEPAAELLKRILAALDINATATVGPGKGARRELRFMFSIGVPDIETYRKLTVPRDDSPGGETIIGAIGVIFRAIAKWSGVRYEVTVERPQ